jgi:hypothetical protein
MEHEAGAGLVGNCLRLPVGGDRVVGAGRAAGRVGVGASPAEVFLNTVHRAVACWRRPLCVLGRDTRGEREGHRDLPRSASARLEASALLVEGPRGCGPRSARGRRLRKVLRALEWVREDCLHAKSLLFRARGSRDQEAVRYRRRQALVAPTRCCSIALLAGCVPRLCALRSLALFTIAGGV